MRPTPHRLLFVLATAAIPFAATLSASAMPSDNPEVMSCKQLWIARNAIFKTNGYCFKTKKAKSYFGNGGCYIYDADDVPLSKSERKAVAEYKHWEIVNGC